MRRLSYDSESIMKNYYKLNITLTIVFILLWALDLLPDWWYEAMRGLGGYHF